MRRARTNHLALRQPPPVHAPRAHEPPSPAPTPTRSCAARGRIRGPGPRATITTGDARNMPGQSSGALEPPAELAKSDRGCDSGAVLADRAQPVGETTK